MSTDRPVYHVSHKLLTYLFEKHYKELTISFHSLGWPHCLPGDRLQVAQTLVLSLKDKESQLTLISWLNYTEWQHQKFDFPHKYYFLFNECSLALIKVTICSITVNSSNMPSLCYTIVMML